MGGGSNLVKGPVLAFSRSPPDAAAVRIAQVGSSVPQLLAGYRALVTLVPPAALAPTTRDPDDDPVLACALGAGAALIVTRDRDLLDLGTFQEIRILAAHDALAAIPQVTP